MTWKVLITLFVGCLLAGAIIDGGRLRKLERTRQDLADQVLDLRSDLGKLQECRMAREACEACREQIAQTEDRRWTRLGRALAHRED